MSLHPGLYEQVINNALTIELAEIPEARKAVAPVDKVEASKVLAQYLVDVVQKGLDNVLDNGGDISTQIELTNQIIALIQNATKEADFASQSVDKRAEQLLALLREADPRLAVGKTAADIERPETSIAQSSLFTGAVHEPQMFTELTAILRKLSQLVHNEPQTAPFDEGHQHINLVSRDNLFLELRKHLRLVNGPSKQRTLGNRRFRPLYIRRSFAHSQPRISFP